MNLSKRELWGLVLLICTSLIVSAWLVRPPVGRPADNDVVPAIPADHSPDAFVGVHDALYNATAAQRHQLAQAFGDLAWVIERDQALRTTGQLRDTIVRFEELLFAKTNLAGAFPGFSAAANAGLLQTLGAEDQLLDRTVAVAALRHLATACDPFYSEATR